VVDCVVEYGEEFRLLKVYIDIFFGMTYGGVGGVSAIDISPTRDASTCRILMRAFRAFNSD
jgi:hypothetical protein